MIAQEYFEIVESPCYTNRYLVKPIHNNLKLKHIEDGSYAVIGARLMGLTYAQYLRYCRDVCNAEIIGKNQLYPLAYFKSEADAIKLYSVLNSRAAQVIKF